MHFCSSEFYLSSHPPLKPITNGFSVQFLVPQEKMFKNFRKQWQHQFMFISWATFNQNNWCCIKLLLIFSPISPGTFWAHQTSTYQVGSRISKLLEHSDNSRLVSLSSQSDLCTSTQHACDAACVRARQRELQSDFTRKSQMKLIKKKKTHNN